MLILRLSTEGKQYEGKKEKSMSVWSLAEGHCTSRKVWQKETPFFNFLNHLRSTLLTDPGPKPSLLRVNRCGTGGRPVGGAVDGAEASSNMTDSQI